MKPISMTRVVCGTIVLLWSGCAGNVMTPAGNGAGGGRWNDNQPARVARPARAADTTSSSGGDDRLVGGRPRAAPAVRPAAAARRPAAAARPAGTGGARGTGGVTGAGGATGAEGGWRHRRPLRRVDLRLAQVAVLAHAQPGRRRRGRAQPPELHRSRQRRGEGQRHLPGLGKGQPGHAGHLAGERRPLRRARPPATTPASTTGACRRAWRWRRSPTSTTARRASRRSSR